jgi:hypothetical protein
MKKLLPLGTVNRMLEDAQQLARPDISGASQVEVRHLAGAQGLYRAVAVHDHGNVGTHQPWRAQAHGAQKPDQQE